MTPSSSGSRPSPGDGRGEGLRRRLDASSIPPRADPSQGARRQGILSVIMGRLFAGTEFYQPPKCERCGKLEEDCNCPPEPAPRIPPEKQTAKLAIEKRKKGKVVTVVRGLPQEGNDLPELLTQLKTACGAGGALKEDSIEIQGKHVERVRDVLVKIGYRVKGA